MYLAHSNVLRIRKTPKSKALFPPPPLFFLFFFHRFTENLNIFLTEETATRTVSHPEIALVLKTRCYERILGLSLLISAFYFKCQDLCRVEHVNKVFQISMLRNKYVVRTAYLPMCTIIQKR